MYGPYQTLSSAEDIELFGQAFGETLRMELYVAMGDRGFVGGRDFVDLGEGHVRIPEHANH